MGSNFRCSPTIYGPCRWCGARNRSPNYDWIFEIKWDGFRCLALIEHGRCRLISRNGNQFSSFKVLCEALPKELNADNAVLDGELVVIDDSGRSVFNDLLFRRGEPRFYAFDVLYCDGKDLRLDGLLDRKRKLKSLIDKRDRLLFCDHIEERGEDLFRHVCRLDLEGVVAKHRNSPYLPDDPECQWVKVKNPEYSQLAGRDDLFAPGEKKRSQPDWAGCVVACAEAEL
jgi:bifunctional non-homologous end joining protein LigD